MRSNGRPRKGMSGRKNVRTRYKGREEEPVFHLKFAEGEGRWYGSGWAIFDIYDVCIKVQLAIEPFGRRFRWLVTCNRRRELVMALKKLVPEVTGARYGISAHADKGAYPCILEHLVETAYPDGSERQTSSLVVVADAQNWRVCLSDRDNARVMWKTGTTLVEALDAIELGLMGDDPSDWRKAATTAAKRKK